MGCSQVSLKLSFQFDENYFSDLTEHREQKFAVQRNSFHIRVSMSSLDLFLHTKRHELFEEHGTKLFRAYRLTQADGKF